RTTGAGCHFLLQCMKVKSVKVKLLSRVRLFETPWTAAYQAPPSMGFSRQDYKNKSSGGREDSESSGPQRRNSSEANSGDFLDLKGEGDIHENVDTDLQASLGQSEEKPVPAAPVPSPVAPAPVPSWRNTPGGKSSLVLG
ncbi:hypothetical protein FD755_008748, partial [Muntiacus reevesi]